MIAATSTKQRAPSDGSASLSHRWRSRGRWTLVVLLAAGLPSVQAIVYSLKPGARSGTVAERLEAKEALRERITVGDRAGSLTVAVTDLSLAQSVKALKALLQDGRHVANSGAFLIEAPPASGRTRRHLLLSLGRDRRTLLVSIDVPEDAFRAGGRRSWPRDLPRPTAQRVGLVVELPGRNSAFGSFTTHQSAALAFREYGARLESAGWRPVSREQGNCAVYTDKRRKRMAVFGVMPDKSGLTRGAVFVGGELPGL